MMEWKQRKQKLRRFDVKTTLQIPLGKLIDISSAKMCPLSLMFYPWSVHPEFQLHPLRKSIPSYKMIKSNRLFKQVVRATLLPIFKSIVGTLFYFKSIVGTLFYFKSIFIYFKLIVETLFYFKSIVGTLLPIFKSIVEVNIHTFFARQRET